jgi:hypothetical protein
MKIRYFILLCSLLNSFFLSGQTLPGRLDSIGQKISGSLTEYQKRYPQEKIYIHTDQNVYLGGQTIWYKAYAMAYGKPSQLSKILYARLYDANGKLIEQDKLPLKSSTGFGNITLPDALPTGWYQLQAFTAWMLNFDKDGFYHKSIYIQNIHDQDNPILTPPTAKKYHINFFPEGGDLVDGNICNIAFKANDENGLPVNVFGDLVDNFKKVIGKLITVHDGMGSFEVETYSNMSYTAQVHFPDGSVQNIALHKVKNTGIGIRVTTAPDNGLEVRMAYADQQQPYMDILIEAVQNNGIGACYPMRLSRGVNAFDIKTDIFSTGILCLTVFDDMGLPEAERLVFINNNDGLNLSLIKDTLSFTPKSKNVFTLNLKDNKNLPVKANLSVSVSDEEMGSEPEDNICSHFLMSSELRGYIYHPAYYFTNNSDTLRQQLDLVMLTNGWRHFKWDTILNGGHKPLKYAVEKTQLITGKILNYHSKDNLKVKLMVINQDSSKNMVIVEPDSTGGFVLRDYNHQGTAKLYYEVINEKNRTQAAKIIFDKPRIDTAILRADTLNVAGKINPFVNNTHLDSAAKEYYTLFPSKGTLLKTVNIKEQALSPTELLIKNHVQRLSTDNVYTLDLVNNAFLPSTNIIDYIQGRFPGLQIYFDDSNGTVRFIYHGVNTIIPKDSANYDPPYFYIDEASATISEVQTIPLTDVALIQFAPPPVYFAPLNGGNQGALLIYLKKYGDEKKVNSNNAFDQFAFDSYSVTREFPEPDYNMARSNPIPDYRSTLYWNHDMVPDDKGNIKIHFYNSDKAKKYRVIVQAMDTDGRLGYLNEEL